MKTLQEIVKAKEELLEDMRKLADHYEPSLIVGIDNLAKKDRDDIQHISELL